METKLPTEVKVWLKKLNDEDEDPSETLDELESLIHQFSRFEERLKKRKRTSSSNEEEQKTTEIEDTESEDDEEATLRHYEKKTYFFTQVLPLVGSAVVDRSYEDQELTNRVLKFLQIVEDIIIEHIDSIDLLKLLRKLWDYEAKFYQCEDFESHVNGEYAAIPANVNWAGRIPQQYLDLINYFGVNKGFDKLLDFMKNTPKLDLDYVNLALRLYSEVVFIIVSDVHCKWILSVQQLLFARLLSPTNQELKEFNKRSLNLTYDILYGLMCFIYTEDRAAETIERFRLAITVIMIRFDYLERRLNGLAEINDFIIMSINREKRSRGIFLQKDAPVAKWLTTEYLIDWIKDNKILESLFGVNIHEALISRSLDIFRLFASRNVLTSFYIDLLWNSSLGDQTESFVNTIYKVIKQMSTTLNWELLEYIMLRIKELNSNLYTSKLLKLNKKLIKAASGNSEYLKKGQWVGIHIFWDFVLEDKTGSTLALKKEALSYLLEMLEYSKSQINIEPFIENCIERLKLGNSVGQALKLLRKLIGLHSKDKDKNSAYILELNQQYDLLTLVFEDIKTLPQRFTVSTDLVSQLSYRIKFISMVYAYSPIDLNLEQSGLLWDATILQLGHPFDSDFANEAFQFFETACSNCWLEIPGENSRYILLEKFTKFDLKQMSEDALKCFFAYFKTCNADENKLKVEDDSEEESISVLDFNLSGLDILWNIILESIDDYVAQTAIDILMSLYTEMSPSLKSERGVLHAEFVEHVMKELHKASATSSYIKIQRCICLLKTLLGSYESYLQKEVASDSDKMETTDFLPSRILARNLNYLLELFKLLDKASVDHQSSVINDLWSIVSALPKNEDIITQIQMTLEGKGTSWETLLDTNSQFKLYYIINSIYVIVEEDINASRFIDTGGLLQVYKILISNSSAIISNHALLTSLLSLFNKFMLGIREYRREQCYILNEEISCIDAIDKTKLVSTVLEFIISAVSSVFSVLDKSTILVANSANLLEALIASNGDLINQLYKYPSIVDMLVNLFLDCKNDIISFTMEHTLSQIINLPFPDTIATLPHNFFLDILIKYLPTIKPGHSHCSHFYKFFNSILRRAKGDGRSVTFWSNLFEQTLTLIRSHPIVETADYGKEDLVIIGLINTLCTIVNINPTVNDATNSLLLNELWTSLLFATPTEKLHGLNAPPKCKTKSARRAAYELLKEFVSTSPKMYEELIAYISRQTESKSIKKWNFSPSEAQRSYLGYAGLKNLGCTCYMNSLIQQLFMIPRFRKGVLSIESPNESEDDQFVYQLQSIFTYLQETARKFYDPVGFCRVNKDYEGNVMNVLVQMDVDEYFNVLCEKLDNYMKNSVQKRLLQNTWCGKLATQLICRGCPHRYERGDLCYTVSLDVKDKNSILEALELYVKGEMLEKDNAYFCEKCNCKRDTLKRTCIKYLPNTLILHLKRFAFDYDTMRKEKVNDYCEFPMTLDMYNYTTVGLAESDETNVEVDSNEMDDEEKKRVEELKEMKKTRPESYYKYELSGILVHRGSSESGHYYSFIKERSNSNKWLEFNDKEVREFNVESIPDECFGGTERISKIDPVTRKEKEEEVEKTRSAYMLIYDRVVFQLPDTLEDPKKEESASSENSNISTAAVSPLKVDSIVRKFIWKLKRRVNKRKQEMIYTATAPSSLYSAVWEDNIDFISDKYSYSEEHFRFVLELFRANINPSLNIVKVEPSTTTEFAIIFYVTMLSRAKESLPMLSSYVEYLQSLLPVYLGQTEWFANYLVDAPLTSTMLIESPVPEQRAAFADVLLHIILVLIHASESSSASSSSDENSMDIDSNLNSKYIDLWKRLLSRIMNLMKYSDDTYIYLGEIFNLFVKFIVSSTQTRQVFLDNPIISHLIKFFLEDENFNGKKLSKYKRAKIRANSPPNFKNFILLIWHVVENSTLNSDIDDKCASYKDPDVTDFYTISETDKKSILSKEFLQKMIRTGSNPTSCAQILVHLSWNNTIYTSMILKIIAALINDVDFDSLKPICDQFESLLAMNDNLREERIAVSMQKFFDILITKQRQPKKTRELMLFIRRAFNKNSQLMEHYTNNTEKWAYVISWFDTNFGSGSFFRKK